MSEHLLKEIELEEQSPVKRLELVIVHWKETSPDGNWKEIVAALKKIGKSKWANLLQQKYATATEGKSVGNNFVVTAIVHMCTMHALKMPLGQSEPFSKAQVVENRQRAGFTVDGHMRVLVTL